MKNLSVSRIEGIGFDVQSGTNHYTVKIISRVDRMGSLHFERKCNCRAAEFGRHCKHVDAVESFEWQESAAGNDYDSMDVLERFA